MFQKRKGLSLIEMIVAVGLVGLLATVVLVGMSSTYGALAQTKEFTADAFSSMQEMEQKTLEYKEADDIVYNKISLFSGSSEKEAQYYPLSIKSSKSNISYYSLIGRTAFPEYAVTKIKDLEIYIEYLEGETSTYAVSGIQLKSEIEIAEDTQDEHYTEAYQWYISREGFTVADFDVSDITGEVDKMQPVFPRDYQILPGQTQYKLTEIKSDYEGRHLVLTATPVANSGRIGSRFVSNSIYISGYPLRSLNTAPLLHLDTGMIKNEEVESSDRINTKIITWKNFAKQLHGTDWSEFDIYGSPVFSPSGFGQIRLDSVSADVEGYSINMGAGDCFHGTMPFDLDTSKIDGFTVFAVVMANSDRELQFAGGDTSTGSQADWKLTSSGFDIEGIDLNNTHYEYGESAGSVQTGKWAVVGGAIIPAKPSVINDDEIILGGLYHSINDTISTTAVDKEMSINIENIFIGDFNDTDQRFNIAELIVIPKGMSIDSGDYQRMIQYLMSKYGIS